MPDDLFEDRRLDDQLAAFTDQILDRNTTGEPELAPEADELRKLQEVVIRLKRAGATNQPSPTFAAKLRAVLNQEWLRSGAKPQPARSAQTGFLRKVLQDIGQYFERTQPRILALQFAAAAVILLLVGLLIAPPDSGAPLTGTAGLEAVIWPIVLVLGVLAIILVVWLARPKGK